MSNYSKLIIYQYKAKPKAKATIDALMGEIDNIAANLYDLLDQWDIDIARGYSLDIIGRRVGVSRILPNFASKGYFGYLKSINGKPWGDGVWYRYGEKLGDSLSLNDTDFRFLIKAKIIKNFQNGTLPYVLNALRRIISPDSNVEDNKNMTATIYLPLDSLNSLQQYMILQMDILPRPMGVMYNYVNASGKEFGFNGFFNSYGFSDGRFIDA